MAKKNNNFSLDEKDEEIVIPQGKTQSLSKVPFNTAGAEEPLRGFHEISVEMLHPFTLKNGNDFSRHGQVLSDLTVESIKVVGIIEVLIVRTSKVEIGMYEIIAGESRWEHAKAAGLKTVPCRIMELSDKAAKSVFNITNILKRDLTARDQINGWYEFYSGLKDNPDETINELDQAADEEDKLVKQIAQLSGAGLSYRQIMRYVKMHDLIPEWLGRLDEGKASGRIGYRVAFFPAEIQKELLEYKLSEQELKEAHAVYNGRVDGVAWTNTYIADHFDPFPESVDKADSQPKPKMTKEERLQHKQERIYKKTFKSVTPKFVEVVRTELRQDDYERAEEIIREAVRLYYKHIELLEKPTAD